MIPDWLEVTPSSGNRNGKLTLTAGPNTGPDREASLAVTDSTGKTKTLLVTQEGLLTIVADLINPVQRIYTVIQSDELYDYFNQIKRFDIAFSNFSAAGDHRFILAVDHFSDDGKNCFSEAIEQGTYGILFPICIVAARMTDDSGKKYIQLAPQHA